MSLAAWAVACPTCRAPLGDLPLAAVVPGPELGCTACGSSFGLERGIWRFLPPARAAHFERFLADYTVVRLAEGRGSDDPDDYRMLPSSRVDHPLAWQWSMRRRTWEHVASRVLPSLRPGSLVVDVGAGVGWMSHRLSTLGHHPMAVDLTTDPHDGLGAARHFAPEWPVVQAEFDRLPLGDGSADLVVFNASLHYSTDYATTLAEALRVLAPGGRILVVDSPVYRHESSGRRMVAERHAGFEARFGTRSDSVPSIEFLTDDRLRDLATGLGLCWQRSTPWYGWRWWARPWVARLRRRREPSRFHVLLAERA